MNDVIALLAEANPVRVDDLSSMASPALGHRRVVSRRLAVAAALLAALAAALVGVFALGGHGSRPAVSAPAGTAELSVGPPVSVEHPLAPWAKVVPLADAEAAFGPDLTLPETTLVGPSDLGPVWMHSNRDKSGATVALTFPKQGMFIQYRRPYPGSTFEVRAGYAAIAREDSYFHVFNLDGFPALAADQNSDQTGHNFGVVLVAVSGVEIRVFGHYDQATLESVARSIIDHSPATASKRGRVNLLPVLPPRQRIALRKASAALGAPVVLPDRSLLNRAKARKVWAQGKCPRERRNASCSIWVLFPSLTLIYGAPLAWPRTRAQYEAEAKQMNKAHHQAEVIDLNGVLAFAINENIGGQNNPGSIDFVVGGTRVVVAGERHMAALRAIARSIVDRSR